MAADGAADNAVGTYRRYSGPARQLDYLWALQHAEGVQRDHPDRAQRRGSHLGLPAANHRQRDRDERGPNPQRDADAVRISQLSPTRVRQRYAGGAADAVRISADRRCDGPACISEFSVSRCASRPAIGIPGLSTSLSGNAAGLRRHATGLSWYAAANLSGNAARRTRDAAQLRSVFAAPNDDPADRSVHYAAAGRCGLLFRRQRPAAARIDRIATHGDVAWPAATERILGRSRPELFGQRALAIVHERSIVARALA